MREKNQRTEQKEKTTNATNAKEHKSKICNLCSSCRKKVVVQDGWIFFGLGIGRGLDFLGGFDGDRVLSELTEYRVDRLESFVNFLADFGAGKNDLARNEDQQDDLGVDHPVNQTRKQLWFVLQ